MQSFSTLPILPVQVREALNVQHVHLVDEEHAGHKLGHAVINVLVHHLRERNAFS